MSLVSNSILSFYRVSPDLYIAISMIHETTSISAYSHQGREYQTIRPEMRMPTQHINNIKESEQCDQ